MSKKSEESAFKAHPFIGGEMLKTQYVKIDRKVLFEICDAILNHYGYSDINDCPENDSECFWDKWNESFRKKVENIRKNS